MVRTQKDILFIKQPAKNVVIQTSQNKCWEVALLVKSLTASLRGNTSKNSSLIAGNPNAVAWAISSQASFEEGSTTIPLREYT